MSLASQASSKSSTVNTFRGENLCMAASSLSFFFFSPDKARKNVGMERLSSVSDLSENLPTDVIWMCRR